MPVTDINLERINAVTTRPIDSHKGAFGNVVVVGGDLGMAGAARIAAEAALRIGAGLVTVLTRKEHIAPIVCGRPELLCYGVEAGDDIIDEVLSRASVIVLGPGLGQSSWSKNLYHKAINLPTPKVVDADALNLLSVESKPHKSANWILTPHPGEAGRLLGIGAKDVQGARESSIISLHAKYGGTIVLKGHGTLVTNDGIVLHRCNAGNPGMATAGMGDLLSGIIAGLLALKLDCLKAAQIGVMRHALAGDKAKANTKRLCVLASDLYTYI